MTQIEPLVSAHVRIDLTLHEAIRLHQALAQVVQAAGTNGAVSDLMRALEAEGACDPNTVPF